jgi:lipid-binding SYLF domain-containing protein
MKTADILKRTIGSAALAGLLAAPLVHAQPGTTGNSNQQGGTSGANATTGSGSSGASSGAANARSTDETQDANSHVDKAIRVMHKMESDPTLRTALQQAQGVFVVPDYGRAALGVGARGGAGVLLTKRGGKWAEPAFYTLGGVSAGAQAGVEGGSIAMILNNQKALNSFKQNNNFSLNADAGLTVLAWSGKAQGSVGKGDVTMWSDTKGLLGDIAVSVTDVNFDEAETGAYYGQKISSAKDVIEGRVKNPHAAILQRALASLPSAGKGGQSSTGSSSTGSAGASGSGNASGESRQPAR